MTVDRRVGIDTSVPQSLPGSTQSGGAGVRREASQGDRQAFEQALAREGGDDASTQQSAAQGTPQPFALFGAAVPPGSPIAADTPAHLSRDLCQAAERLLVGDGSSGRREVRIELKDEVLPGVTVSVYEDMGRLVAAFVCASEPSRERLCACAQALADELSASLRRPVLVRVTTDDPEDLCLFEAAADAAAP